MAQLCLFGLPSLNYQETLPLNIPSSLLFYLAVKRDWVSRSELAFLYRPDESETEALKYLRLQLYRAQQYAWANSLEIEKNQVRWLVETDVDLFKIAIEQKDWLKAIKSYRGSFFARYSFSELATYSAWIDLERDGLEQRYRFALCKQIEIYDVQAEFTQATELSSKVLALDELDEETLQQHLRHLALAGQKDAALKHFVNFSKLLKKELDGEPLEETLELIEQIRHDKPIELKTTREGKHNLPSPSTRFIGRKRELLELNKQLSQSECRLLSLIGLGGIGKSRLGIELARSQIANYQDGVYIIELAALETEGALLSGVAQTLGLQLSPEDPLKTQLLNALRHKHLLLIFDNFEHLLTHAPLLTEFLAVSDKLKIVVTSRESLKLKGEWIFDVEGLAYPNLASISNGGVDLIHNDAVSLFVSAAKQVQPQVEPSPEDLISIGQIARQVEGLPLALELAASWVRIMPIARIAQELTQGYELLEAELTDIPERHRNLRSILDKTWTALSEKKRETLAKFSVFVGGCTLEAAEAVTKTHYSILLALVNEALLKRTSDYRFDMHPLIRHYAVDKLGQDSTQEAIIQSAHSAYYRTLVRKGGRDLCMGKDYRWQIDYLVDYNNLLAVLNRSLHAIDTEQSLELCAGLWFFWFSNGKFKEGINFCQQALHISSGESEAKAETLNGLGALSSRVNLEEGKGYLEQGLAMSQGLGFKYGKQNALFYLSNVVQSQNDLSTAESYMLEALRLRGELGYSVQQCVHNLGNIYYKQGKFQEAEEYYQQALEICQRNNNAYEIAIAQGSLANVAMKCGNYQKAEALLLASRQLYQLSQDKAHLAYTELTLGVVAYHAGNHSKARAFYDTALHMGQEINWTILIANCYLYLALLDYYDGAYPSATHWLERCLALCATNHFTREAVWTNSLFISIYALREPNKALAVAKQAFDLLQGLNAPDDFRLFLEHLLLFLESHNLTTAITLYAIVEMLQDRLNVVRPVFDQRRLDQFKINAQVSVGLEVFNICYQQGKDMKPEAVTTYLDGLFRDFPR